MNDIINDNSNCCKRFLIIDKDKISKETINELKECKNFTLILSDPSIEIVLYAIFNTTKSIMSKEVIEQKLNQILKSKYKIEYKHDVDSTKKLFTIFDDNDSLKEKWIKNIEQLNKDNKSNFIDFVNFLKGI